MSELQEEKSQSTNLLESDNITYSIVKISLPMMITGFVDALYNMVDSIFVGRFVGETALAALSINNTIQIMLFALAGLYGGGITSIISRALGAKNYPKVTSTIINGMVICFISTNILSFALLLHLDTILTFMGSSPDVLQYSRDYGQVILWFGFVLPVNSVFHGVLRAKGAVKEVMYYSMLGAVLNIILDALFIIVFKWEVKGAAWATVLSQLIVFVLLFRVVCDSYRIRFQFHYLKNITVPFIMEIYSIGISSFMRISTFAIMGISANRILSGYGAAAVASFGIINRIMHLAYQPIYGSNLGTQSLIGFNYGANRFSKVQKIITKGILLATCLGVIPSVILLSSPVTLFELFTTAPEIIEYTKIASRMTGSTFFLYGVQIFSTGALLAMGHPKEALFLSLLRPCIMVVCVNLLPRVFGIDGVWATFPVTDLISTSVTVYIITKELKLLKKKEELLKELC